MTNFAAAGISFFATEDAAIAQADALKFNAKVADNNALTTRQQGQASDQALSRNIASTQGAIVAQQGGSGVQTGTGSAAEVLADSIRRGVLDRATNSWNFEMKALNFDAQATADRLDARNVMHAAVVNATSAGLASFNGGAGGTGGLGTSGSTAQSNGPNNTSSSILNGSSWGSDVNSVGGGDYGYLGAGSSTNTYQGGFSLGGSSSGGWGS